MDHLEREIHSCRACPRLIKHCREIATLKRRAYQDETYWGKPISGFGDPRARLLIVGLAPGAHGANRTGRIFTGDRSGEWLYRAIYKAGFSNQPRSEHRTDGLKLRDAYITCVVKCAPPGNKPMPQEIARCSGYLERELGLMSRARVIIALGQIALHGIWPWIGNKKPRPRFSHGAEVALEDSKLLLLSYHPSQQNTFTGRLTEKMLDSVFAKAREFITSPRSAE